MTITLSLRPLLGLIWAQGRDRVIGRDGAIPWHVPEDFAFFKRTTTGAPIVMGRHTWESLPQNTRPLPGRENIVISRAASYLAPGAHVETSLKAALTRIGARDTDGGTNAPFIWVIGGGQLYREAIALASLAAITEIDLEVEGGDTFAPELGQGWQLERAGAWKISRTGLRYRFTLWRREELVFSSAIANLSAALD